MSAQVGARPERKDEGHHPPPCVKPATVEANETPKSPKNSGRKVSVLCVTNFKSFRMLEKDEASHTLLGGRGASDLGPQGPVFT